MKKVTNFIFKNKWGWITLILTAVTFAGIGPYFFNDGTLNVLMNLLPKPIRVVLNFIFLDLLFFVIILTLIKFLFGVYNEYKNRFKKISKKTKLKNDKGTNKIVLICSIILSTVLTIFLFF